MYKKKKRKEKKRKQAMKDKINGERHLSRSCREGLPLRRCSGWYTLSTEDKITHLSNDILIVLVLIILVLEPVLDHHFIDLLTK